MIFVFVVTLPLTIRHVFWAYLFYGAHIAIDQSRCCKTKSCLQSMRGYFSLCARTGVLKLTLTLRQNWMLKLKLTLWLRQMLKMQLTLRLRHRWILKHKDYLCLLVLDDIKRKETDNVKFDLNSNKLITFSLKAQFKLCYLILKMYIILSFIHPVYLARFHCFANRTKQVKDRSVVDLIALRLITSISRLLDDRSLRPPTGPVPTAVSRP